MINNNGKWQIRIENKKKSNIRINFVPIHTDFNHYYDTNNDVWYFKLWQSSLWACDEVKET